MSKDLISTDEYIKIKKKKRKKNKKDSSIIYIFNIYLGNPMP